MHSFWILLLAAGTIISLCTWWIRRPAARRKIRSTRIEPNPEFVSGQDLSRSSSKASALQTISAEEFRSLVVHDRNYILVDVASEGRSTFVGDGGTFVLSIAPGELPGVLEWLPADRVVVFRGLSDSARALIEESVCMASSKPRCVLSDLSVAVEVL